MSNKVSAPYEAPRLEILGTVESATKSANNQTAPDSLTGTRNINANTLT